MLSWFLTSCFLYMKLWWFNVCTCTLIPCNGVDREINYILFYSIDLVDKISSNIDNKKHSIGIFLDLSKAFDTIDHQISLRQLQCYGIRGIACHWFKSYLQNRVQYVSYNTKDSDVMKITCGVPQGSILGPLLFILYINDIVKVSTVLNPVLFADDTSLFHAHTDFDTLIEEINEELQKITAWFHTNKLSLIIKKIEFHNILVKR